MKNKIDEIRKLIKKRFERTDWQYHILLVIKYAKKLAKIYKVDENTVELAALLHDIGRAKIENDEVHHITGVVEAKTILKDFNYSEDIIKEVKHCIESHRRNKGPKPKTMIAKIIANADAMAHFDALPVFFYWKGERGHKFEDILDWADKKIKDDWKKKITLPEAKKMMKKKYEAIMLLINSLKK